MTPAARASNPSPGIIRAARQAGRNETLQTVAATGREGVFSRLLAPFASKVTYAVPQGRFAKPILMDGALLEIRLVGTEEVLRLVPELGIYGVLPGEGQTVAERLHPYADQQIAGLREIIDGIFLQHIDLQMAADTLDGISSDGKPGGREIQKQIGRETGLQVQWNLRPEPAVSEWLRALQRSLPTKETLTFNAASKTGQFNLTFSLRVEDLAVSRLHRLQQRVETGCSVTEESEKLFSQIKDIMEPAFSGLGGGLRIWERPTFWDLMEAGFNGTVARRIQEEFGYNVRFRDFGHRMTASDVETLRVFEEKNPLLQEFESARAVYEDVLVKHQNAVIAAIGNAQSDAVKRAEASLDSARMRMNEAKVRAEEGARGPVSRLASPNDGLARQALLLLHSRLGLGADLLTLINAPGGDSAEPEKPEHPPQIDDHDKTPGDQPG